jgi:carbon-monoxide dehydrogenase small subunit
MTAQAVGIPISIKINGKAVTAEVAPGLLLVDFLRDSLGLTGTKQGCETGQCGACTVLLAGKSAKSCATLAAQVDGAEVTTIEGVGTADALTPIQQAMWENHAVQCGYCTPAMVLALTDLLARSAKPSEAEIRGWLDGIMCRCGTYQHAISAVMSVTGQTASTGGR